MLKGYDHPILDLIDSTESVPSFLSLELVNQHFHRSGKRFLAVVDDSRFVGLCASRDIRSQMSNRYGFDLFFKAPIRDHLMESVLVVEVSDAMGEILSRAFSRTEAFYYDDLVVIDSDGRFLGLVPVHRLAKLQHQIMQEQLTSLQSNEEELSRKNTELLRLADKLNVANEALGRARDEALESTRLKSEFLANMSHEIRTPMNGVIGMVDLLMDTALTQEQRFFSQTIQSSAESLLAIINDILDFSKIEADRIDLCDEPWGLVELMDSCLQQVVSRASQKPIRLLVEMESGLARTYRGDSLRLQQVIVNLLANAVKFTEQGEVTLRVRASNLNSGAAPVPQLEFEVEDTGVGIADEHLNCLFLPFVQVDGSSKRRQDGSGLGLSICQRLVTLMGGDLSVQSELGKGSCFAFRIPAPPLEECRTDAQCCQTGVEKVALITTNEPLHSHFANVLAPLGVELDSHRTLAGAECFAADMPVVIDAFDEGVRFLDELRLQLGMRTLAPTRILVLLRVNDSMRSAFENLGVTQFLYYPFRIENVLEKVNAGPTSDGGFEGSVAKRESDPCRPSLRILLVEDHLTNRKITTILLSKMGHEVDCAENGLIALQRLKRVSYDCVLMDCMMPEMDGFECTRIIRQGMEGVDPGLPIIALTARAMKGDREKCLEAGMDDYVSKPLSRATLEDALGRVMHRMQLTD